MGNFLKYIAYVPVIIIKIALGIVASVFWFPIATIALIFKVDTFEAYDEIWKWVFDL